MAEYELLEKLYGKSYDLHFCAPEEIDKVLDFLDSYWKKGHVLTRSETLLNWQHFDKKNNRYNFILAVSKKSGEIHGLYGFIPTDLYDEDISRPACFGAIWKTRPDAPKGLGLFIKLYVDRHVNAAYFGSVRLNENAVREIENLGQKVYDLKHFYMLNRDIRDFSLAANVSDLPEKTLPGGKSLKTQSEGSPLPDMSPYASFIPDHKSVKYYKYRYELHPFYKYRFSEIINEDNEAQALIIWRLCEAKGSFAISVIDYIGDGSELCGTYAALQGLLHDNNAEYISFYEFGLNEEGLISAGFSIVEENGPVIPLYFEPFEQKNVFLNFYLKGADEKKVRIFKGDGDGDRPSLLPG